MPCSLVFDNDSTRYEMYLSFFALVESLKIFSIIEFQVFGSCLLDMPGQG